MADDSDPTPLRFSNAVKVQRQMTQRGWTEKKILEALQTAPVAAVGKLGPALRYIYPVTGKSVVVDANTGERFHVDGEGFRYG